MIKTAFINRQREVDRIVKDEFVLLNICGEGGVGKTRLLKECVALWEKEKRKVILVDFQKLNFEKNSGVIAIQKAVLQDILNQVDDPINGVWSSENQVAGLIVRQFNLRRSSLVLILDTTEHIQAEKEFWDWLEKFLLRPLIQEQRVKIVVSGRSPIRWEDFEVRSRAEKPLRLVSLDESREPETPAAKMIQELFDRNQLNHLKHKCEDIVTIILNLSCGNPRLMENMVAHIIENTPATGADLEYQLGEQVVKKFIQKNFFMDFEKGSEWPDLLWWMSVLDQFDTTILKTYLPMVLPDQMRDKSEYFYMQGIRSLHEKSILIWKLGVGEVFQGAAGKIIARCFKVTRTADYIQANQAASKTMLALKENFLDDEKDLHESYDTMAKEYARRAQELVEVAS